VFNAEEVTVAKERNKHTLHSMPNDYHCNSDFLINIPKRLPTGALDRIDKKIVGNPKF